MTDLRLTYEWDSYADSIVEVGETTARFGIYLDKYCLTRNEDIWSKTVRDHVIVSLYPLALWFATSWWRLNYEILPAEVRKAPPHDWRMSHEMAAANMGFVWPKIMFSADEDNVQIWAQASQGNKEESIRYLNGLNHSFSVPREQFAQEVSFLIESVLARLHEVGCKYPDLGNLWTFISEDQRDAGACRQRRLEAELGFDPEDCPDDLIRQAIHLEEKIGADSFSELTGAYASNGASRLSTIQDLISSDGMTGKPNDILKIPIEDTKHEPWQAAVSAAHFLRRKIGNPSGKIEDSTLQELLGLSDKSLRNWSPAVRPKASVAGKDAHGEMKFVSRKRHPVAQRFELARFVGDFARSDKLNPDSWLVTADLATTRQKFQRAFAAEFLCPIDSVVGHLQGDFSESALEDAADYFSVSEKTVESLLMNNGYFPRHEHDSAMPYSLIG